MKNRKLRRRSARFTALVTATMLLLSGCGSSKKDNGKSMEKLNSSLTEYEGLTAEDNKIRTTYEVFVYSFADSNGDGIGDLNGLTANLDYINDGDPATTEDLGCTEIWVMPIFSSPTYHKYDTTDYEAIDSQYGTMEDFDRLLDECHKRGVKLILDIAVNHTSSEHPWFVQAADYMKSLADGEEPDASKCKYASYYNFSKDAHSGYEMLDTRWYYEARFWSGMPDLNLDNPEVKEEIKNILYFWLDKGVDGFRLDAVTSYYTEDKQCSIDFIAWLNETVKTKKSDAYIVGEAWTDQSIYSEYYSSGADSFFDFNFSGQDGVIASVVRGNKKASYYAEQLVKEEELYKSIAPDTAINAPFYTNHDMARSAGYYASDDGSKTKLAGALNLMMTGNAFIYYGEELGMKGSGKDENKRLAFPWCADSSGANGEYLCKGPADADKVTQKYGTLEEQKKDEYSIYNYYKEAIRVRNAFPAISKGKTEIVDSLTGDKTCGFIRKYSEDTGNTGDVLIVINTGSETEKFDLSDVSEYKNLAAILTVNKDKVTCKNGKLTLPAYGIAILTK